jgi:hypothetical protein
MMPMKRFRRIAWNGLAAISALACIVVFVPVDVTVMGLKDSDNLRWSQSGGGAYLFYDNLRLHPDFRRWNILKSHPVEFHYLMIEVVRIADVPKMPVARVIITIPWWFSLPTFALLPISWLLLKVSRRRYGIGRCASCGYDLRATSGRCPECGTLPVGKE